MDDGADGGLVVVAVLGVGDPGCRVSMVDNDMNVSMLAGAKIAGREGGLEVVESRARGGEDPGQCVVGVAHVGDGVVEDQGATGCCLDGVVGVDGIECCSPVQVV